MKPVLLLLAAAWACMAQPFSAGLKVGVPLTDFVSAASSGNLSFSSSTQRYILGAEGELRLPFGLGIELDVLYRRLNYSSTTTLKGLVTEATTTSNAWEFPLVAKYKFKAPVVRPYVEAGVAWDTLQGLTGAVSSLGGTTLQHNTTRGFVMGGGVDIHVLVIHISPEIRYTRWGSQHFIDPSGLLSSNQNQAEFLLGITF